MPVVDILKVSLETELGLTQTGLETSVAAFGHFTVDQQPQTFFETEV